MYRRLPWFALVAVGYLWCPWTLWIPVASLRCPFKPVQKDGAKMKLADVWFPGKKHPAKTGATRFEA